TIELVAPSCLVPDIPSGCRLPEEILPDLPSARHGRLIRTGRDPPQQGVVALLRPAQPRVFRPLLQFADEVRVPPPGYALLKGIDQTQESCRLEALWIR